MSVFSDEAATKAAMPWKYDAPLVLGGKWRTELVVAHTVDLV
jgi:hypothetical protein